MSETRTKKRRRILLGTLLVLVILAGIFIVKVVLFIGGKPAISTNYAGEYNERLRPANLALGDNAAPLYQEAFARLPAIPDDMYRVGHLWKYEFASIEWRIVETWLTESDEALRLIQQAAQKPGFWVDLSTINYEDPTFVEEMGFTSFRQAMIGLRYQAQYSAVKGDTRRAFDGILAMYRMARHLGGSGRMQINLSQAIEGLAHATAFDLLAEADLDAGLLSEFQRQVEQVLSQKTPPSFGGDEILLRDAMQRYFTDNGHRDGHLIPHAVYAFPRGRPGSDLPPNELAANAFYLKCVYTAWTHPSRQRTMLALLYLVESANELIRQTPWELHDKNIDPAGQLAGIIKGNHFLQMMQVDQTLAQTISIYHRARTSGEALVATMAILRFHAERELWPLTLDELVTAGYLRQVPIDPYSGMPLVYKRTDDSFILYSWGLDFDDDGGTDHKWGQPPQGGDRVFCPVEGHTK